MAEINREELVKILEEAAQIVDDSGVSDELRPVAYETILERMLGKDPIRSPVGGSGDSGTGTQANERESGDGIPDLRLLATKLGIELDKIQRIFDADQDGIDLVVAPKSLNASKMTAMREVLISPRRRGKPQGSRNGRRRQ